MKITIIYDTVSGNTRKMAEAVAEGVRAAGGIEVVVKHVDDAVPEDLLSEGVIIGSPTYCGLMTWKLKAFFDNSTGKAWGRADGHIGAAFSSSLIGICFFHIYGSIPITVLSTMPNQP